MIANPKLNPKTLYGKRILLRPVQGSDAAIFAAVTPIETFRYYVNQWRTPTVSLQ